MQLSTLIDGAGKILLHLEDVVDGHRQARTRSTSIELASSLAPVAPPITIDQIKRLRTDNVADGSLPGLEALGVDPTPIETVLPAYLVRFRNGGQYAEV